MRLVCSWSVEDKQVHDMRSTETGPMLKEPGMRLIETGPMLKEPGMRLTETGPLLKEPGVRLIETGPMLKEPGVRLGPILGIQPVACLDWVKQMNAVTYFWTGSTITSYLP